MGLAREMFHAFFRTVVVITVVVLVWVAAGAYYRESFREEVTDIIQYRVRQECVRPPYIQSALEARAYDLTLYEMDLISQKMRLLNQRTDSLVNSAERLEQIRYDMVQARQVKGSLKGSVGGPLVDKNEGGGH